MKTKEEKPITEIARALQLLIDRAKPCDSMHLVGELAAGHVLEVVQNYICYSYWCDINPLAGLRKSCPGFIWEHFEFSEDMPNIKFMPRLLAKLKGVDFFWPMPEVSIVRWVAARKINRNGEGLEMCGCFENHIFYDSFKRFKWMPSEELDEFMIRARKKSLALWPEAMRNAVKLEKEILARRTEYPNECDEDMNAIFI